MQNVAVPHPSHRLANEPVIRSGSGRKEEFQTFSLHEVAVRICIEALAGGSHQTMSPLHVSNHVDCGNTLVLTVGDSPIWASRNDTVLPCELFSSAPQDGSGGIFARHVTHQQCLYHLLATRLDWVGAEELCLYSIASSERSHDDTAFERLVHLANELRAVAQPIAEHSETLQKYMTSDQPCLFVACDSGTVVMASPGFLRSWQRDGTPVGMRFTDLVQGWPQDTSERWSTRIIQLRGNTCPVTIVTFVAGAVETEGRLTSVEINTVTQ
jgi:hypothetical protein